MRSLPAWSRPRHVAALLAGYLVIHFAVRLSMWPTLGIDDAEQALFAQHWLWSYRFRAPPLFTWLLLPVSAATGMNIVALSVLRYVLLGAAFGFIYLTALRLLDDRRLAALSLFSFAAVYVFAYYSHHDLTHTTMMAAMVAVSWYVFVRLYEAPTPAWYLLLGLCFGLGTLGKWNFIMLAVALPLACLALPRSRHLVLTWKVLAAGAVAAAVVLPPVVWLLRIGPAAGDAVGAVLGTAEPGFFGALVGGTAELAAALLAYPQPFLVLFLVCFAAPLWRGIRAPSGDGAPSAGPRRPDAALLGWTMAISAGLHWLLVPITGATEFSERWMQPALMILPVFLFMLVERGRPSGRAIVAFALLMAAMVAVALGARVVTYVRGADHCGACRAMVPFDALADQLRQAGYRGGGTILADGFHTGGNMRVQFPDARLVSPGYPPVVWPPASGSGPCLLVWKADGADDRARPDRLLGYLETELAGRPGAPHREGVASALMRGSEAREYRLGYRLYPGPVGDCR